MNIKLNCLMVRSVLVFLAASFLLTGCATAAPTKQSPQPAAKKCKVGLFIDRGSAGSVAGLRHGKIPTDADESFWRPEQPKNTW